MKPVGVVEVYNTKSSHSLFLQKKLGKFDEFGVCLKNVLQWIPKIINSTTKSCYT